MNTYIRSLADPFDGTIVQPKLLDGRVSRTAGIRFRTTGDVICNSGTPSYIILFPGFQNNVAWLMSDVEKVPVEYPNHIPLSGGAEASGIDGVRLVSVGLRLSLINSSHENEGYWEAGRFQFKDLFQSVPSANADPAGGPSRNRLIPVAGQLESWGTSLAQNQSFQTGKLRDIHRFQFKLNSTNSEHEFVPSEMLAGTPTNYVDKNWDCVVLKIHGRVDATSPTVLHYDVCSNQEVVYNQNTVAARIMGPNTPISSLPTILLRTNYKYAAIRLT
ncbi:MAG: capsid protein [Bacilladnavirus sp.]|nr:MAG: capsid protein [Bacilladnavirus sp.]